MALPATVTISQQNDQSPSSPVFADVITMAGPSVYGTDVWNKASIESRLQTAAKDKRQIVSIIGLYGSASLQPIYDPVGDAVKVFVRTTGVENATADISATTFSFLVISK